MKRTIRVGAGTLAALCLGAVAMPAVSSETAAPAEAPAAVTAEMMPLAVKRSLVLDIVDGKARAIAVGERGHILVSEQRSSDWRQVKDVPTRSTLTGVAAVGDHAWAVGHDGVILHSADGGETWEIQRFDPWKPLADDADFDAFDPRQGAPLLDVMFLNENEGYAIGAYSLMLHTTDGGKNWNPVSVTAPPPEAAADADAPPAGADEDGDEWTFNQEDLVLDEESDPHLNAIARTGSGGLLIVAERGSAFRSRDNGKTWSRVQMPYAGSMFGVIGFEGDHVLAFGLRGNVLESRDLGDTWQIVDSGVELSLMGGAGLANGGAVLVGANGVMLHRDSATAPLKIHTYQTQTQETPVLAAVLPQGQSTFVVAGEAGLGHHEVQ